MISKNYPQNLLHRVLDSYDPTMNRLDYRTKIMQRRANRDVIDATYEKTPEVFDGLINVLFALLPQRSREILELRYQQFKTLNDIGKQFHISGERVRQLETRALNTLRAREIVVFFFDLVWPENAPANVSPIMLQPVKSDRWVQLFTQLVDRLDNDSDVSYAQKVYEKAVQLDALPFMNAVLHVDTSDKLVALVKSDE